MAWDNPDLTSIAQRRNGIASLGAGVKRAEIRADVGYIVDSSERQGYVRLAKVLDGVAKTNHRGLLAEDAITPEILNSCFIDDTAGAPDGWTLVKSTGDIATSTDEPLFENIADWGIRSSKPEYPRNVPCTQSDETKKRGIEFERFSGIRREGHRSSY